MKLFPTWAFLALGTNILVTTVILLVLRNHWLSASLAQQVTNFTPQPWHGSKTLAQPSKLKQNDLPLGGQLSYKDWIGILGREAKAKASQQPQHLSIIAGDSLSRWFPDHLLPQERIWLNQAISGETSTGLLRRLSLFDQTQPEIIFVMIGVNDLLRGVPDNQLLANQQEIMRYLRRSHPQSQIVFQSILPHAGASASWEGRDRLLKLSNIRIRELNRKLAAIASTEGVSYLDLYPLFVNEQGDLRPSLSTDGLHLNYQGYIVWRSALQVFIQLKLPARFSHLDKFLPSPAPSKIKEN
ncbi:MAG TPA: GDSL-type esterase/lipase family protein [Oculatellaceae cyanobacterium]